MDSELVYYKRQLKMELPKGQSAFLWGARKTGKSTYLRHQFPTAICYDLLQPDLYWKFVKEPHLFKEEILGLSEESLKNPIILDGIQRIPQLLDKILWLIENKNIDFILCSTNVRPLKTKEIKLLGKYLQHYSFYPLVHSEISNFDLLHALNNGLLPIHYFASNPKESLKSHIQDYLIEEIQTKGLTRNFPAFVRFLEVLNTCHGTLVNFSTIARQCKVDSKTVKEYYQILIDTLLGYFIYPFNKKLQRDIIITTPKFYLFDTGIANILANRTISSLQNVAAEETFKHFILLELIAYRGIYNLDFEITYWKTKAGLTVDFILGEGEIALEIVLCDHLKASDVKGLIAFQKEHRPKVSYVISLNAPPREINFSENQKISILPWKMFLERLWKREII